MIVETYRFGAVTVHIDDSAYAGKPEEELEKVRENLRTVARQILQSAERRRVSQPPRPPAPAETA